jgi:hypothetical protein
MSKRYQGGVLGVGFNPLQAPNAPTIGTATAGDTTASVAFTAPANVGGSAITSYAVQSTPGGIGATGASSPITVSGLTNGTSYAFRVTALNSYGPSPASAASNSVTPVEVTGQQAYTTAGTFSWVAPAGVTSVSIVTVGAGGVGAGGGLGWKNNITVIPGNSYSLRVGNSAPYGTIAQSSYFIDEATVRGGGGSGTQGAGGTYTGDGGGNGGNGGGRYSGGGAGGYTGNGGGNPNAWNTNGVAGSGGGGGSGASRNDACTLYWGGGGGGVGILGLGSDGAGGVLSGNTANGGGGGSGGASGAAGTNANTPGTGGLYGGGGGLAYNGGTDVFTTRLGGVGAVRIIWPGTSRSFPSTNTGDL